MSITMDEEIKRWTAKRKSALVLDIIQGKTTISEASKKTIGQAPTYPIGGCSCCFNVK